MPDSESSQRCRDQIHLNSAWKLGGTNYRSQKQFNNHLPLFGAVSSHKVYSNGECVPYSENTCIELEVAVKIPEYENDDLEYALCFELPQKRIFKDELDHKTVLLDGCGANALVVQTDFQRCKISELSQSIFRMSRDSVALEATTLDNLISSPPDLLFDFLYAARTHGVDPMPGQIVAIGGLGECFPISSGQKYLAENRFLGSIEARIL